MQISNPLNSPLSCSYPTGKAHLKRAIMNQEDALRSQSLCPHLRKLDILNTILEASHKRSLAKFEQNNTEDEFTDYMEAPDIICESKMEKSPTLLSLVWIFCYRSLEIPKHFIKRNKVYHDTDFWKLHKNQQN